MADVDELSGRVDFHDQVIGDYQKAFDEIYERLGKLEEAVNTLQGKLESAASNSSAGDVEGRIGSLEGTVAELKSSVSQRLDALSAMYSNLSSR